MHAIFAAWRLTKIRLNILKMFRRMQPNYERLNNSGLFVLLTSSLFYLSYFAMMKIISSFQLRRDCMTSQSQFTDDEFFGDNNCRCRFSLGKNEQNIQIASPNTFNYQQMRKYSLTTLAYVYGFPTGSASSTTHTYMHSTQRIRAEAEVELE